MSNTDTHSQLFLKVPKKVFERLGTMAKAANMSRPAYAELLLNAAYTARCAETGDRALDAAVARVALLWGQRLDTAAIADHLGLNEGTVERIRDAWRAELTMRERAA